MRDVNVEQVKESENKPQSEDVHVPALAGEVESLKNDVHKYSVQVNDLSLALHDLQTWVVGAMQRETAEVCD